MNIALDFVRNHIKEMPIYEPILPYDVLSEEIGIPVENLIKLDANENPYGSLPEVNEVLATMNTFHVYPDPQSRRIKNLLASYHQIPSENLVIGAGADELIDLIMRVFLNPGDGLINCPPTFGMYTFDGALSQASIIQVPRRSDFSVDVLKIENVVVKHAPKLLFLAHPNNPDGSLISRADIERILELPLILVLDEAYINFSIGNNSFINFVENHHNLIVLRTFSKWAGLAGLRIGYGVFPSKLARILLNVKQPYNVSSTAEQAAVISMENIHKINIYTQLIIEQRNRLIEQLNQFTWLETYSSQANFVLCKVIGISALKVKQLLREQGILIRHFDKPSLNDHIRISVGKKDEIDTLINALKGIK